MDILDIKLAASQAIQRLDEKGLIPKSEYVDGSIPFDGKTENKACFPGEYMDLDYNMYHVSDNLIPPDTEIGIMICNNSGNTIQACYGRSFGESSNGSYIISTGNKLPNGYQIEENTFLALSFADDLGDDRPRGTYVARANDWYVASLRGKIIENVRPIAQKYIPPMDSITLNGADGKQYKVTVNESGVLTATEVG